MVRRFGPFQFSQARRVARQMEAVQPPIGAEIGGDGGVLEGDRALLVIVVVGVVQQDLDQQRVGALVGIGQGLGDDRHHGQLGIAA